MSEQVKIQKTIYSLEGVNNTINTKFNQLIPPSPPNTQVKPDIDTTEFFNQYNLLFFEIPLSGSDDSHLGLATRSLEYLGLSLDDLQSEIDFLRQENVELKNQVVQISKLNPGDLQDI
jgi:hypothetical protein